MRERSETRQYKLRQLYFFIASTAIAWFVSNSIIITIIVFLVTINIAARIGFVDRKKLKHFETIIKPALMAELEALETELEDFSMDSYYREVLSDIPEEHLSVNDISKIRELIKNKQVSSIWEAALFLKYVDC